MNKIKSYFVALVVIAIAIGTTSVANASFLSVGSRGGEVADLQTFLIGKGFPIPLIQSGYASKGYFGTQTKTAVEMYQESVDTQPTGSIEFPVAVVSPILGAAFNPDSFLPYFGVNNVRSFYDSKSLAQGTSTVCAIRSPIAATSTLILGAIRFGLASTSAMTFDIGKGTTPYATTTLIGTTYAIGASAQATIVASSTVSGAGDAGIFAPGSYFLVIANTKSGTTGVGNVPTGVCKAVFTTI